METEQVFSEYKNLVQCMIARTGVPYSSPIHKDVEQAVWLSISGSLGNYDPAKGELKSWIGRVAVNTTYNFVRDECKHKGVPVLDHDVPDREPYPYTEEQCTKLLAAVNSMDSKYAMALKLRYGLGGQEPMTSQQVGDRLGISHQTVLNYSSHAIDALKIVMQEDCA